MMANEALFTPGPWKVSEEVPGAIVAENAPDDNLLGLDPEDYAIFMSREDALLAAASPEMYGVLGAMVSDDAFEELCWSIGDKPQWLKDAKRVMAKARGEATA